MALIGDPDKHEHQAKHADVMPVPRCDQCQYWKPTTRGGECGVSDTRSTSRRARLALPSRTKSVGTEDGW